MYVYKLSICELSCSMTPSYPVGSVKDIHLYIYTHCLGNNTVPYHAPYNIVQGMEAVLTKGLTRAIGVSNFTITKTANLLKTAKMVPAVNQVECHPYFQQQKLKEYCDGVGEAGLLEYVRAENAPRLQTLNDTKLFSLT